MRTRYNMPRLGDLACFEAAARHLSFKNAARELNVTPAAVSHRVKALEEELRSALFVRNHRGVDLTEVGAYLFVSLQRSFEAISDCVAQIAERHESATVTIGATTAMSGFWLTPRLSAFWKTHGDIPVNQIVHDSPDADTKFDLSIHYGDPTLEREETRILFRDRILALGSPQFAAKYGISRLSDLQNVPLVHVPSDGRRWTDWPAWFEAMGLLPPNGPTFNLNNYMISLQAAEDDVGAVLGWEGLVGNVVRTKRLIVLVPEAMESPWPFYLRIHRHASANARLFANWLAANTAADATNLIP